MVRVPPVTKLAREVQLKVLNKTSLGDVARTASHDIGVICIGYRLRWRSDI